MNPPSTLYTKCFKIELEQKVHTLIDTGSIERLFFDEPKKLIEKLCLSEAEVIVKVPAEAFYGSVAHFKVVGEGIWENKSVLLMKYLSADSLVKHYLL